MFVTTLGAAFETGAQLYMVIRSRRGGQVYVDTSPMRVAGFLMWEGGASKCSGLCFLSSGREVNMNSSPETEEKAFVKLSPINSFAPGALLAE